MCSSVDLEYAFAYRRVPFVALPLSTSATPFNSEPWKYCILYGLCVKHRIWFESYTSSRESISESNVRIQHIVKLSFCVDPSYLQRHTTNGKTVRWKSLGISYNSTSLSNNTNVYTFLWTSILFWCAARVESIKDFFSKKIQRNFVLQSFLLRWKLKTKTQSQRLWCFDLS